MSTNATRNTTTGLIFEEKVSGLNKHGINVTKYSLYRYMESKGLNWEDYISRRILPDEAYLDYDNDELRIYEKKFQKTSGSADEKPQTCGFKIMQFNKLAKALGVSKATYTYILNDWFKQPMYKDMLDYIKSIEGCDYYFSEE
jgi:hypothetical protein